MAPPGAQRRGARGPRGAGGTGVVRWRARGLSPAKQPSGVPVSAWGRLSTAATRASPEGVGEGGRSSCATAACGLCPRRGRFLGNEALARVAPSLFWVGLPSPIEALQSEPRDPRRSPGVAWGAGGGGGGEARRAWEWVTRGLSSCRPAFLRLRWGCAGGWGPGRPEAGATSLFPPGLRLRRLKRVFPVGLPSRVRPARPPGTRSETCMTPPGPRTRAGGWVERLERRESPDPGFQPGLRALEPLSDPVAPKGTLTEGLC